MTAESAESVQAASRKSRAAMRPFNEHAGYSSLAAHTANDLQWAHSGCFNGELRAHGSGRTFQVCPIAPRSRLRRFWQKYERNGVSALGKHTITSLGLTAYAVQTESMRNGTSSLASSTSADTPMIDEAAPVPLAKQMDLAVN
jgi:hypothetical protein